MGKNINIEETKTIKVPVAMILFGMYIAMLLNQASMAYQIGELRQRQTYLQEEMMPLIEENNQLMEEIVSKIQ